MKNERRSQLEKFESKMAKKAQDTDAIIKAELERKQRLLDRVTGIVNADKLSEQGGIEEAAAVFSYAGMEIFATSFSNTVREMIRQELPNLVRDLFREELHKALNGMLKGVQYKLQDDIKSIMGELHTEVPEVAVSEAENVSEHVEKTTAPQIKKQNNNRKQNELEANIIAETLKSFNGKPVKLRALVELLPDVNFGVNPYTKINNVMKYESNILKLGKGEFAYKMDE